jgi:signal transduction histidine kinase/CheY-like chemotaxis protein
METIGVNVNTMIANARTDALLEQSQRLTAELQARQQELQRSNAELADKAGELDLASRYKSQFLANMSHELRTPLNSLLVLARLLAQNLEGNLTAKQVEYATIIHSSGSDLLRLINDILDLTKVEAGKMEITPERFALAGLVEDLRGVFGPLTEEKRLRFMITTAPGVPAVLETDKQRLRQILYNLLSNAVKFTDHGRVELHIDTSGPGQAGADTGPWVVFSVTDTGIGIGRDNLSSIFSAFQQADGTTSRRYGGTGLGLAICREVAARLGGEVTVRSELGVGSTFSLRLPLAVLDRPRTVQPAQANAMQAPARPAVQPSTAADVRPVPAARAHAGLTGHRILVVDDDPRNAFVLTDVLEMHGMTVVQATDGRKAIATLAAGDIDLVLMDVMMPQMDGYETTRAIRKMPEYASLPVITVTARAMQGDREKSIDAGASDYITKPIDIEELLNCMERWLSPPSPAF